MIVGQDYQIRPLAEVPDALPFVLDSFRQSLAKQFPWSEVRARVLLERLKRTLASPDTKALVAVVDTSDEPSDLIAGWVVATPGVNAVDFAFVRYSMRRMGIGSTLALAAGVDLTKPTGLRYWTRAAERMNRKPGYSLYFKVTDDEVAA